MAKNDSPRVRGQQCPLPRDISLEWQHLFLHARHPSPFVLFVLYMVCISFSWTQFAGPARRFAFHLLRLIMSYYGFLPPFARSPDSPATSKITGQYAIGDTVNVAWSIYNNPQNVSLYISHQTDSQSSGFLIAGESEFQSHISSSLLTQPLR